MLSCNYSHNGEIISFLRVSLPPLEDKQNDTNEISAVCVCSMRKVFGDGDVRQREMTKTNNKCTGSNWKNDSTTFFYHPKTKTTTEKCINDRRWEKATTAYCCSMLFIIIIAVTVIERTTTAAATETMMTTKRLTPAQMRQQSETHKINLWNKWYSRPRKKRECRQMHRAHAEQKKFKEIEANGRSIVSK